MKLRLSSFETEIQIRLQQIHVLIMKSFWNSGLSLLLNDRQAQETTVFPPIFKLYNI